ncbi:MAG TPA: hypothetical protein VGG06_07655 [Thermoanaerobaculia bacterium]
MGRLIRSVTVASLTDPKASLRCDAMIDTGSAYMVLPSAWKDRLGDLDLIEEVELETATQETVRGELCGPVRIQLEGFRHIYGEVVFVDMKAREDGFYEPLVGYITLEQSHAAVDMVGHRLIHIKRIDMK